MRPAVALAPEPGIPIAGPGRPDKYLDAEGKQLPSVTTITGRFKNASALLAWANKEGLAGRGLNEARDQAADTGHIVHQWIQDDIHGKPLTTFAYVPDETLEQARNSFAAFKEWAARVRLRVIATEMHMVHSALRFGGTWDGIGLIDGVLSLLDWKSGKRTYPEHLVQLAAYRELLRDAREHLGDKALPVPEVGTLIRIDKETGKPHARSFGSEALDLGWDCFEGELRLYRLDQSIEKMVAEPKKRGGKAAA